MKVLLVSPGFHRYHDAISAALVARGHHVVTHVYDDRGGLVSRGWHQLSHQLPHRTGVGSLRRLARAETSGATTALQDARPDAVVVVKGDTLGEQFWTAMRGLPRVTWLYDEVRRTRWTGERLSTVGPIATYSALDATDFGAAGGIDAHHVPLAFDHRLVASPTSRRVPSVSFVGARYPSREHLFTALHQQGVPVHVYGRDWSAHPVDRLRTWRLGAPRLPAGRDVSRTEAYDLMTASVATLNPHANQDGFTMRTFEAAGVGAVELINRTDVDGLYEPGAEVLTWTSPDELTDLCRRAIADSHWTDAIRAAARSRTLAEHTFDHRVAALEDAWDTA